MGKPESELRIGVIGTGALGRHHVRILSEMPGVELVGLYDLNEDLGRKIAEKHGTVAWPGCDELAREVDAAVVAVPTVDHADVGCRLLEGGVHVLVEKPIAPSLEEADRLLEAAGDRVLAVGHVEFYNPAVQRLLELRSPAGFVEVHRLAAFTPRSLDIDVVLDLMIHDLQILHALDESDVAEVRATGISVLSPQIDIANARIALDSGCVANITASRVSAERVRKLRVFMPGRGYYSLDYQQQEIQGYCLNPEVDGQSILPDHLEVEKAEPLREELQNFVSRCRGREAALVDGIQGRRALRTALEILEEIAPRSPADLIRRNS